MRVPQIKVTHYEKKARLATPQRALVKRNFGFGLSVVINPGGRGHRGQAEQVLARVFVALHISRRGG